MDTAKRLERSVASIEELSKKLKLKQTAKADYYGTEAACVSPSSSDLDYVNQRIDWLRDDLNYLSSNFYEHTTEGHLPPIIGVTAMKKAISVLGMSDEYQVQPTTIYASDGTAQSVLFTVTKKK